MSKVSEHLSGANEHLREARSLVLQAVEASGDPRVQAHLAALADGLKTIATATSLFKEATLVSELKDVN